MKQTKRKYKDADPEECTPSPNNTSASCRVLRPYARSHFVGELEVEELVNAWHHVERGEHIQSIVLPRSEGEGHHDQYRERDEHLSRGALHITI